MLMRDFEMKKANRAQVQHYPDFAATLARLQVESLAELDAWRELACPVMDLDYLQDTQGEAAKLFASVQSRLGSGKDALSAEEISQLGGAMEAGRKDCKKLSEYGISSSLAHLDFRPDNWFFEDQKCRIMDWSDVAITHPFMSLCQLLDFLDEHGTGTPGEEDSAPVNEEMKQVIVRSYLGIFAEKEGAENLEEVLQAARAVYPLFSFYCVAFELQHVAAQGPKDRELRNSLKQKARALVAGYP